MFKRVLIANRGEIAIRIARAAASLGVDSVAVFTRADAMSLHTKLAGSAREIGGDAVRGYLDIEAVIAAAKASGSDCVHPGYGFLSENALFAERCKAEGLRFIGPWPDSLKLFGDKVAARDFAQAQGIPVIPGAPKLASSDEAKVKAKAIGYPVMLKASAGGGGRGMRAVTRPEEMDEAFARCQGEAEAAFGDRALFLEKIVPRPRHIEVRVFGDSQGNVVHLFERDCSLQRRHQKVIEEAPAPGMDEATRAAVCGAAVKAARAVDYVGAGTIEFIADASEGLRADRIWFMEMNTRLQVEHPVTEAITGQDLVEWQLRVASGEILPKSQDELGIDGWAIEARLYAEDPLNEFLPSTGRLQRFKLPRNLRIDTGVAVGGRVTPFYDPMIAKVIAHARSRDRAISKLKTGPKFADVWPAKTNSVIRFRAIAQPEVEEGDVDTGFIPRHLDSLLPLAEPSREVLRSAAVQVMQSEIAGWPEHLWPDGFSRLADPKGGNVWREAVGFRLNADPVPAAVRLSDGRNDYEVPLNGDFETHSFGVLPEGPNIAVLGPNGQTFRLTRAAATGAAGGAVSDGSLLSPTPGRVISVEVR